MPGIKRLALQVLTLPALLPLLERTSAGTAAVFTLHRFSAYGRAGHDPALLVRNLEWLRRRRYHLVSIHDLVRDAMAGTAPHPRTVAFTVDDGYADFAEVAAPLFARFDCPVTVFLITGFLDGGMWMWWDRVRFAAETTGVARGTIPFRSSPLAFALTDLRSRRDLARDLIARLKLLPDPEREAEQRELERYLEVSFAAAPPPEYGPMSWEQVRALAAAGVSFGPHSLSHPILARTDDARSRREITGSWIRLSEMIKAPVPVFCWPNGDASSFGPREERVAQELGMLGALSTMPASFTPAAVGDERRYALPRYAYPAAHEDFVQLACGLERLKDFVRSDLTAP